MTPTEPTVYTDSARKGNGCVIVLDAPASRNVSGYQETSISADASKGWNDPSVPAKIREMLAMYEYGDGSFKQKCLNFYRQGKFMEDYEDDFPWEGEFRRYFPTYHDLNIPQLRGYFTWRTHLRKGEYRPIATSMAYIYLYELLNGIGTSSVEESLWRMQEFETNYLDSGIGDFGMEANLRRWMLELAIIHQLPLRVVRQYADPLMLLRDKALHILRNPDEYTDEEVSDMLCRFAGKKYESSPVVTAYRADGKHLFAEVWRYASIHYNQDGNDLFTACFGPKKTYPWYPLANAVYLERAERENSEYELDECRRYLYQDGRWKEEKYEQLYFYRKKLTTLLHLADLKFRRYLKTGRYLRENPGETWASPYVDTVIKADKQAKIEAARPKINIDLSHLVQIRADAVVTRDSLLTEEDLTEAEGESVTEEIPVSEIVMEEADTLSLDPLHRQIVVALLDGQPVEELMAANRLMPSIVTDTINEAFFDEIGDNILECDGDRITLVGDYVEDVRALVGAARTGESEVPSS